VQTLVGLNPIRMVGRGRWIAGRPVLSFVALGLLAAGAGGWTSMAQAQSGSQQPSQPAAQDNPFPGESGAQSGQAQQGQKQQGQKQQGSPDQPKPAGASDNPFPGENTDAPIIPVEPGGGSGSGNGSAAGDREYGTGAEPDPHRGADPDGDPMRSPDLDVRTADDGFTSSRTGLKQMPVEDDNDGKPGKSSKNKTRSQLIKEDVDVGSYYLERKNWKAAQARFAAAFALDGENPDAVWGMAEAERHLDQFKEAADHYKLFLNYDPDGPHSKSARKALDEVEAAAH
jgi:tetratricopeptide (TPR) repeat protein